MSTEPPQLPGIRRSFVEANGVRFHVTEAGPVDAYPVIALHGWPQHHWEYRDLLADPPAGLRIIAPDLPGYGWSGPAPHKLAKEDVATDLLALMDALNLDRVLLVAHDWGAFIGYLMILRAPERFDGYLTMNMPHPWQSRRQVVPNLWRLHYQLPTVTLGRPMHRYLGYVRLVFKIGSRMDRADIRIFSDRFRDPVCARAATDTYRTFLFRELPHSARHPERRSTTVPIRALYGTGDVVVPLAMMSPETARAEDYTLETIDASHFVVDERPEVVRKKLIALAEETAHPG